MKNFTKELIVSIATEMYKDDGKFFSESYSQSIWEKRGWPEVDDIIIYRLLDSHIKFLRCLDEYNGTEKKLWKKRDILGRIK